MAAPTPTARVTPVGIPLKNGYSTLVTLALDTDISFWEKTVQPPGLDGGDAIETTTMHNIDYRTFAPQDLVTMTEMSLTVAYDPAVYTQILALINRETTITVRLPDGSTVAFFGYLRSFEPSDNAEGEFPEATIMIQPTNVDFTNDVEAALALSSVSGT